MASEVGLALKRGGLVFREPARMMPHAAREVIEGEVHALDRAPIRPCFVGR